MSEKPSSIRLWLARYKPDRVRCTLPNREIRELPRPQSGRGQWAHLEHAILTLAPSYIEALVGETCVASRGLVDEEDDTATGPEIPVKEKAHPFAAMVGVLPVVTQLIVDAGDASAQRHQDAYKMAFEAMLEQNKQYLELVRVVSVRLGSLEKAWHEMLLQRAAASSDENDSMATALLGNILNRNGAAPKNGAAPAKPEVEADE